MTKTKQLFSSSLWNSAIECSTTKSLRRCSVGNLKLEPCGLWETTLHPILARRQICLVGKFICTTLAICMVLKHAHTYTQLQCTNYTHTHTHAACSGNNYKHNYTRRYMEPVAGGALSRGEII